MKSLLTLSLFLPLSAFAAAEGVPLPTAEIEQATGLKGAWNEAEQVFKVTRPRKDVPVSIEGRTLPPFMGFTSWAAFVRGGPAPAMLMGDIVLFEDEVDAAMSAALNDGLQVTALHNHFFYDEPKVYFMHIGGEGDAVTLARAVRAIFAKVDEVRAPHERAEGGPAEVNPVQRSSRQPGLPRSSSISIAPLDAAFGVKGNAQDGMAKYVWGRKARMECGCEVGKEMGVNTWAAFYGSDTNAAVCGDFVVLEPELQPVLRELRHHGMSVVAIHHHMIGESPRYIFLHYWGRGGATELAGSVKAALAVTAD